MKVIIIKREKNMSKKFFIITLLLAGFLVPGIKALRPDLRDCADYAWKCKSIAPWTDTPFDLVNPSKMVVCGTFKIEGSETAGSEKCRELWKPGNTLGLICNQSAEAMGKAKQCK